MVTREEWFVDWFDSHHYHNLYANRDIKEAEDFINRLFEHLKLPRSAEILDLACGKGRHAVQVNQLGFQVLGVDLSENNIRLARHHQSEDINFEVADMRDLKFQNRFDLILNLFTSFGYFKKEGDNIKAISSISQALKKDGLLVLDYLNVLKVQKSLPSSELIKKNSIKYKIEKEVEKEFIVKQISFEEEGKEYQYKEYVKCIDLSMFKQYFEDNGLSIVNIFGDYNLNDFDNTQSDRLILLAKKI